MRDFTLLSFYQKPRLNSCPECFAYNAAVRNVGMHVYLRTCTQNTQY